MQIPMQFVTVTDDSPCHPTIYRLPPPQQLFQELCCHWLSDAQQELNNISNSSLDKFYHTSLPQTWSISNMDPELGTTYQAKGLTLSWGSQSFWSCDGSNPKHSSPQPISLRIHWSGMMKMHPSWLCMWYLQRGSKLSVLVQHCHSRAN